MKKWSEKVAATGEVACYATTVVKKDTWLVRSDSHLHLRGAFADVQSRDCVNEKVAGVGGGGGTCYNCGEAGHMVSLFPVLVWTVLMIVSRVYRASRPRFLPR